MSMPPVRGLYDPAHERDSCGVGFIAHVKGHASRGIVRDALTALDRMSHRSGRAADPDTGDGAGILVAMPDAFLRMSAERDAGIELPEAGRYAVGMMFMPPSADQRGPCRATVERYVRSQGQVLLGWRRVPTNDGHAGASARATQPAVYQVFIEASASLDAAGFERQLYLIRKQAYHTIGASGLTERDYYQVCSLSSRVIVYKGQLTPGQLAGYYSDLSEPTFASHAAMFHARFSTNTFPSWSRAQPLRLVGHNGEINTLRGNINWMRARQSLLRSELFGAELEKLHPIIDPETSDSGIFDNVLELLVLSGRSLPEAMMMMVPSAWEHQPSMRPADRAFYEYHASLLEPWDGPALVTFTDGRVMGALLDRNGLRPSRYYVLDDDRVIMASEVGVLDVAAERIVHKGRLEPGRMFLIDFERGRIVSDESLRHEVATQRPYAEWLERQRITLDDLPRQPPIADCAETLLPRLTAFGYTTEHLKFLLRPMVLNGVDPTGSMGSDTPLACVSDRPRLLYDYFKQLFAQVTNPPIDSIREGLVMSLACSVGPEGNLLEATEAQCHRLRLPRPVVTNGELSSLQRIDYRGWRAATIDITYPRAEGQSGLEKALDRVCQEASAAVTDGCQLVVLSDRATGPERVPVSALLCTGAVHHHLMRTSERTRIGIIVETGEAREVHHFCLLVGYGADAVNPYLAFEALRWLRRSGELDASRSDDQLDADYIGAASKGMLKVMARMGISTLASYKGAQVFEAVGVHGDVIERCFAGTPSRLSGVGWDVLAEEARQRHDAGYPRRAGERATTLGNPGEFQWRAGGERHAWNPVTIASLQEAVRHDNDEAYAKFAQSAHEQARSSHALRSLLRFRPAEGVVLADVEPASAIVKRFCTGAMSFGALSAEAHETLAVALNRVGGKSNSGEGGEDAARFRVLPNGDSRRSAIKQVASGRFGVTIHYLTNADQIQIKMAQGAKPGEGGELPGGKVSEAIARVRHTTPGVMLISPPPHHDIYSIEDLAQLIYDLKNANPSAAVSVKLVAAVGVGAIAAGVAKAGADHILISGHDGGTGASPVTSIRHAGLPWELGLAEAHQTLVLNGLRERVRLEVDGQLRTGRDVAMGALFGAEEFGFSTAPLIALGCIMMRKCHLNTCPVGICTQDPELRRRFTGQPEHVINYLFMVAEETRSIMARLGFTTLAGMVGRADMMEPDPGIDHWKARTLDLTPLLLRARPPATDALHQSAPAERASIASLDRGLIDDASGTLAGGAAVRLERCVTNADRAVGTMLSHEIAKRHGAAGLPDGSIHVTLRGSAGQSLGAWLAHGVTLELEGDANDYVGKGLSGGRLIAYPPRDAVFVAEENVLIGNVVLYGAVTGEAFFRGMAGERFCVRNSGADAVVEGVGDHGCEYMTGGTVVILGGTGRNFAAGMSGGVAFVLDAPGTLHERCNHELVETRRATVGDDVADLHRLLERHLHHTGSPVAGRMLANWPRSIAHFTRVAPRQSVAARAARAASTPREHAEPHPDSELAALGADLSGG
jgi:glutamate synthase (NADPH/NADH) large chain